LFASKWQSVALRELERPFLDWAKTVAMPVRGLALSAAADDLQQLTANLQQARLIGLGEATHGTHEFFAMKNRIIAALAPRGLTDVIFEVSVANAIPVDDYIQGGPGTAEAVVHALGYWIYDTEEVVELVTWLRAWNSANKHQRIHFRGIDMNAPKPELDCVRSFASQYQIPLPLPDEVAAPFLFTVSSSSAERAYASADKATLAQVKAALEATAAMMDAGREDMSRRSGAEAFDRARRCMEAGRQSHDRNIDFRLRERFLAVNTLWWLQRSGSGGKAVIWGHNSHIRADAARMGSDLRRQLSGDYVPIGFFFEHGEFQAKPTPAPDDVFWERVGPQRAWRLAPASATPLEAALSRIGSPMFGLDLRGSPKEGQVGEYVAGSHSGRFVGSVFNPAAPSVERYASLRSAFDVIMFVAETTAAKPTAAARAKAGGVR
jgi:erythromycin esterase